MNVEEHEPSRHHERAEAGRTAAEDRREEAERGRLAAELAWSPRPTSQAFEDFVGVAQHRVITPESARAVERRVHYALVGGRATLTGQGG